MNFSIAYGKTHYGFSKDWGVTTGILSNINLFLIIDEA